MRGMGGGSGGLVGLVVVSESLGDSLTPRYERSWLAGLCLGISIETVVIRADSIDQLS